MEEKLESCWIFNLYFPGTFNTEEDLRRNRGEWNKKVQRKQKHPQVYALQVYVLLGFIFTGAGIEIYHKR
ncbi:hypothetical protein Bca101_029297 [Brassica carinata]